MVVQCPKTWYSSKKTHQRYHGTFATFWRCIYCPELFICRLYGALRQWSWQWQVPTGITTASGHLAASELAATPPAAVAKRPYKAGHASSFWRLRPHCATKRTKARAETMRNYPSKQPDLDTHELPGRTRETISAAFELRLVLTNIYPAKINKGLMQGQFNTPTWRQEKEESFLLFWKLALTQKRTRSPTARTAR